MLLKPSRTTDDQPLGVNTARMMTENTPRCNHEEGVMAIWAGFALLVVTTALALYGFHKRIVALEQRLRRRRTSSSLAERLDQLEAKLDEGSATRAQLAMASGAGHGGRGKIKASA